MKAAPIVLSVRLVCVGVIVTALVGCDEGKDEHKSLRAANEEIRVLKAERDSQKQTYEKKLRDMEQLYQQKQAELEKQIATLSLDLGAARREKLALQGIVDKPPRVEPAIRLRMGMQQMVLFILLLLSLFMLGYTAFRYRALRERLNLLVMREVAQVRYLGGGQ